MIPIFMNASDEDFNENARMYPLLVALYIVGPNDFDVNLRNSYFANQLRLVSMYIKLFTLGYQYCR